MSLSFTNCWMSHGVGRSRRDLLDLVVVDNYPTILFDLVSLYDFRALDHPLARRAEELLFDSRAAFAVNHVETNPFRTSRREQPHRNRDQAKRYIALPNSRSHRVRGKCKRASTRT